MKCHTPQVRIVFLQLKPIWGVAFVLRRGVPAHTGNARLFLFGALQVNDLARKVLFCHDNYPMDGFRRQTRQTRGIYWTMAGQASIFRGLQPVGFGS